MIDNNAKIKGILQSNSLDELPLKYLPPVSDAPDNYYFISYSHLDYKYVYKDIFALQSQGVNVWYDRGMPAGISWKETAEKYIRPSRCAGVVFYVSENSLLSHAIHEEIAFAKKCGKSCLTINIPLQENGKSVSAKEMLDIMISQGKEISAEKYDFICDTFNTDVLYLPYSAEADAKAEKITALKKPPLLQFRRDGNLATVRAVNDIEVKKIEKSDFEFFDSETGKILSTIAIENCAFANCKLLETVELPLECRDIQRYAFYGCSSLKHIDLSYVFRIGENAFFDCCNLESVDLSSNMYMRKIKPRTFYNCQKIQISLPISLIAIEDYAFGNCQGKFVLPLNIVHVGKKVFSDDAEIITSDGSCYCVKGNCLIDKRNGTIVCANNLSVIPKDNSVTCIGQEAFLASGITEITIPKNIETIGESAFHSCCKLKTVVMPNSVKDIGQYGFSYCKSLEKIVLNDGLLNLGHYAFSSCENLKEVIIGNNLKTIPYGCFKGCKSLKTVDLGNSVLSLEQASFSECYALKEVKMGVSVNYIGMYAFYRVDAEPVNILYEGTLAQWKNIQKASQWTFGSSSVHVICSDGEIII